MKSPGVTVAAAVEEFPNTNGNPQTVPKKSKNQNVNREISWLSFNARVLQEAADPSTPLIERLRFLGIFSSNLDEFFRVRVGSLKRMITAGVKAKAAFGGSPKKILKEIHDIVLVQRARFDYIFPEVYKELGKKQIFVINEKDLTADQADFVRSYFRREVRPRLVPIMLDSQIEFPYLRNQVIYLAIHLSKKDDPKSTRYALIEVPADILPRFIALPETGRKKYIIMLDDIIRFGLSEIFAIFDHDTAVAYTIKLTRDAELDIEDDITKSAFEKISKSIKQRITGQPVRFVYDRNMPKDLLNLVLGELNLLDFDNVISGGRYHNAKDFIGFPRIGDAELSYDKCAPIRHPQIERHSSLFKAIREGDILLHYPYHSFDHTLDLLREAAIDPKVTAIKMTLYRVASNSNIVNALVNAIRNGKEVSVLIELKARFDEEANIHWTKTLEEAGAHLLDSVPGLKVHAKLCLITRREGKKSAKYAVISTGNFNESTARIYSDHSLLTSEKNVTYEVDRVFRFLENNYKTYTYKHLIVSPFYMRKRFTKFIKNEIKNAQAGKPAYIDIKVNSLVDETMIDWLYQASQAGVKIRMIVRGICSLVPGVKGKSENIEVISIVDKYLEHSRLFVFRNNGDEQYFLSSADWMIRNLDNRVEVATPVYDKKIQAELRTFFDIQWRDNSKARIINQAQDNTMRENNGAAKSRAQVEIYDYLKSAP